LSTLKTHDPPTPHHNSDNGLALNDFLPAIFHSLGGKVKIANYSRANKADDIDLRGTFGNYQRNEPGFALNQIEFSALMADDIATAPLLPQKGHFAGAEIF